LPRNPVRRVGDSIKCRHWRRFSDLTLQRIDVGAGRNAICHQSEAGQSTLVISLRSSAEKREAGHEGDRKCDAGDRAQQTTGSHIEET